MSWTQVTADNKFWNHHLPSSCEREDNEFRGVSQRHWSFLSDLDELHRETGGASLSGSPLHVKDRLIPEQLIVRREWDDCGEPLHPPNSIFGMGPDKVIGSATCVEQTVHKERDKFGFMNSFITGVQGSLTKAVISCLHRGQGIDPADPEVLALLVEQR